MVPVDDIDLFAEEFAESAKAASEKPVAKPVEKKVEQPKKVEEAHEDNTEEEEIPSGVISINFGEKISSTRVPRFKGTKDFKSRIAVLTAKASAVRVHYTKETGSFICFDGICCENEGYPRVKYLIPVVQYDVDRNGKIVSDKLELKVLVLGPDAYSALADIISLSGRKANDVDILVSCSDENYQKLTFAADLSTSCSWKTKEGAKEIVELYKSNKNRLYRCAGKVISKETYLAKKGYVTPTVQTEEASMEGPNLEDLLE